MDVSGLINAEKEVIIWLLARKWGGLIWMGGLYWVASRIHWNHSNERIEYAEDYG